MYLSHAPDQDSYHRRHTFGAFHIFHLTQVKLKPSFKNKQQNFFLKKKP